MVEKKPLVLLSPKSCPPPNIHTCQLGPAMITNIHFPTWLCLAPGIIAIGGQPPPYSMGLWAVPQSMSDWFSCIWARYTIRRAKVLTLPSSNRKWVMYYNHWNVVSCLTCYFFQISVKLRFRGSFGWKRTIDYSYLLLTFETFKTWLNVSNIKLFLLGSDKLYSHFLRKILALCMTST